jgi:hypothetical protein
MLKNAPQPTRTIDTTGRESLTWDFGHGPDMWTDARDFVLAAFPEANWNGVGYWNIPRTADIFYGCGTIKYVPKKNKPLPS